LTSGLTYVHVLFVSAPDPCPPDPYLAELADLAMDLARDLHRRAKKTPDDAQAVQLAAAFERLARSVRLCRLTDQRLQDQRRTRARDDHARRLDHRKAQLKCAIGLAIDQQHGLAQATRLRRELSERLEHDRLFGVLATGTVDEHIARLTARLGLEPACETPTTAVSAAPPSPDDPPAPTPQAEPQPTPRQPP
jgi:hypothetical protein